MKIEELCEKLKPTYGRKIDQLWYWYLAAKPQEKALLEVRLNQLYQKNFPRDQVLLEPAPRELAAGPYILGEVCYAGRSLYHFGLHEHEWIQHLGIFGRSGSGKTNLVCLILWLWPNAVK